MPEKTIIARVFRMDPAVDRTPDYREYEVPLEEGMSALDVLDYIYQNLDGTLAYYDHAGCGLGICARCTGRVNGKAGLLCQVPVAGDVTLEPASASRVLKDLVCEKRPGPSPEA
jgi:succinate dehydrogenase/fumarate reductase-like Fe-S protein